MLVSPDVNAAAFFARLHGQHAAFSIGLPALLDDLTALHDRQAAAPSAACAAELQRRLDTLSGCAATFGYRRLGVTARALEQRLRVLQAFERVPGVDWLTWLDQLEGMIAWARADPHAEQGPSTTLKLLG